MYHLLVIRRFYVHNFRCLENFELPVSGQSSVLLIGNNGSGKTTVGLALEILQKIARGTNQVSDLVKPKDLARGRADVPMRFEIEVELEGKIYGYTIVFELKGLKELLVLEEKFEVGGRVIYAREAAQTPWKEIAAAMLRANLPIDRHLVALPLIQEQLRNDPLLVFKQWLARMLILRPIPSLILGDSK
jgi:ABC-type branched-subunit amino acid transport system ATPase component